MVKLFAILVRGFCLPSGAGRSQASSPKGTQSKLVSSGRELDSYVGHEVEITAGDVNLSRSIVRREDRSPSGEP